MDKVADIIETKKSFMDFYNKIEKIHTIKTNGCDSIIKRIEYKDDRFVRIEVCNPDFIQSVFNGIPNTDRGSLILACRGKRKKPEAYFVGHTFKLTKLTYNKEGKVTGKEYTTRPVYKDVQTEIKLEF